MLADTAVRTEALEELFRSGDLSTVVWKKRVVVI